MPEVEALLKAELARRQQRNPAYSLRAFSRDMRLSATILSQVLNGKRRLSRRSLLAVAQRLEHPPLELGVAIQDATSAPLDHAVLREDEFRLIADWYYLAILNLAKLKTCRADPAWIGRSLNLQPSTVKLALDRLARLGYVKVHRGRLIRTKAKIRTTFDVASDAIKANHRQSLDNAARALAEVDPKEREFLTLTADIATKNIPRAKELIRKFLNELCRTLQNGPSDEVYSVGVHMYPLSKTKENL